MSGTFSFTIPPRLVPNRVPRPVSIFEAYKGVPVQQLEPEVTVSTPEVPLLPFSEAWAHLHKDTYSVPGSWLITLKNVLYDPENAVLLTDAGELIVETTNNNRTLERTFAPIGKRGRHIERLEGTFTLFHARFNNYYHTLLDNIPRIAALRGTVDEHVGVLCRAPLNAVEKELIGKMGPESYTARVLSPDRLYRLERVIVAPFRTRQFSGYLPASILGKYREAFSPERNARKNLRVIISRAGASKRRPANEDELTSRLEKHGFTRYYLENLTLQQQAQLFYDAEIVVGCHGAGFSNLVFGTGAKVLEIFPTWFMIPHFYYLAQSAGYEYAYVAGSRAAAAQGSSGSKGGSIKIDVARMRLLLAEFGIQYNGRNKPFQINIGAVEDRLSRLI